MTGQAPNLGLRDLVRRDGVGPVWCDGREILRRIFVTVRDANWKEVPPTQWNSEIDEGQRTATLTARHVSDSVDFEWKGTLRVSDDSRSLRFEVVGQVLRDMEVCRLGLVVLHPVESMVGSSVAAVGPEAGHRMTVGEIIAPQPVVGGIPQAMTEPFSKLIVERTDFGRAEFQFEGDLFELEDQRNWGDGSFKRYCTPLRLGFPRGVRAGAVIAQSVEVRFGEYGGNEVAGNSTRGAVSARSRASRSEGLKSQHFMWAKDRLTDAAGVFPRIGREWRLTSPFERQGLDAGAPRWDHLYVEAGRERLAALRALLESVGSTRIALGIEAGDDGPSAEMVGFLLENRERIARVLLCGARTSLVSNGIVERWRQDLVARDGQWAVPLLATTRGYFVEFNRGLAFDPEVSGIAFPMSATVHSDDAETICDGVPAIRDMVETGRRLTGVEEVVVAPLALYHPRSAAAERFPRELVAPWLVAVLINAALVRVASVSLAEDVLDLVAASGACAPKFISELVECSGHEMTLLEAELPHGLHGVVFASGASNRGRALLANLTSRSASISLSRVGLRASTARDAVTGKSVGINTGHVEIPAFGVMCLG
jgi:hypothetical protein